MFIFDIFAVFVIFFFLCAFSTRARLSQPTSPLTSCRFARLCPPPAGDTEWLPGQELPSSPWDLVRKPLCQCITIRLKGTNLATLPLHSRWFPRQQNNTKKKPELLADHKRHLVDERAQQISLDVFVAARHGGRDLSQSSSALIWNSTQRKVHK